MLLAARLAPALGLAPRLAPMPLTARPALGAVVAARLAARLALTMVLAAFRTPGLAAFSRLAVLWRCLGAVSAALGAKGAELSLLGLGEGSEDRCSQLGLGGAAGSAAGGGGESSELFPVGAALGPGLLGNGADLSSLGRRQAEATGHAADVAHLAVRTPAGSSFCPLVLTVSLCSLCSLSSVGAAGAAGAAALAVTCTGFLRFFGGPPVFGGFGHLTAV